MIKVDKGIPLPPKSLGGKREEKYPWKDMEVGDSFFVPGKKSNRFSADVSAGKRLNMKFSKRAVEGGLRIWRIA